MQISTLATPSGLCSLRIDRLRVSRRDNSDGSVPGLCRGAATEMIGIMQIQDGGRRGQRSLNSLRHVRTSACKDAWREAHNNTALIAWLAVGTWTLRTGKGLLQRHYPRVRLDWKRI